MREMSLFDGTKLLDTIPFALDVNRAGDAIYVHFLPRGTEIFQVVQLGISPEHTLIPQLQLYAAPTQNRAYVRAHPTADECLILGNIQESLDSPVLDTVWRAMGGPGAGAGPSTSGFREPVRYLDLVPDLDSLPPDTCYGLEPFYTWDGKYVITPLKSRGLCQVNSYRREGKFFEYPPVDFEVVGITGHVLPDQDGSRIALLRWYVGTPELEQTQIDVLNLDAGEWEASVVVPWPVYEISAQDIVNGPWLLSGSRFPQVNTEHKRVPRLSRADPYSGAVDIVEFYGEPYWNVRLDSTGEWVVYMDQQREGLVRLNLMTGVMDIDKTWFEKDAKLFISPGADPVYAWKDNMLYRAKWSEHEQHPGLEAE